MSLAVAILGPEGVVLAADSRITLTAERPGAPPLPVNFDTATKLLGFSEPHSYVGAVTYGTAVIGLRSAHSLVPEFEVKLEKESRLPVKEFADRLSEFFLGQWQKVIPEDYDGPSMMFIVGGFDPQAAYGRVFLVDIPNNPEPVERNPLYDVRLDVGRKLVAGDIRLYQPAGNTVDADAVRPELARHRLGEAENTGLRS